MPPSSRPAPPRSALPCVAPLGLLLLTLALGGCGGGGETLDAADQPRQDRARTDRDPADGPSPADADADGPVSPDGTTADAGPDGPPAAPCTESALEAPTSSPCGKGSGIFGRWIVDDAGLPAYEYTMDQLNDPRALYPNTEELDRRDHWHQIGNDRITAAAYNDGYIQLLGQERGATWYNRFAPEQGNFAGGFSFIGEPDALQDERRAWSSAYRYRPEGSMSRRVFGLGYVEYVTEYANVRVTRRTYAPAGDAPFLVTDVTVRNLEAGERQLSHYEFWDVNQHQLTFQLTRSATFAAPGNESRDRLNERFLQSTTFDDTTQSLRAHLELVDPAKAPGPDEPAATDSYPRDVVLTTLAGPVAEVYSDQARFFAAEGEELDPEVAVRTPAAVLAGRPGELLDPVPAFGQPACLAIRSDIKLPAQSEVRLRFAYGTLPGGEAVAVPAEWRDLDHDLLAESRAAWKTRLAYFASTTDPAMHREVAWRSYYLQSASTYLDFFGAHVIAQGAAYLYLHGFDGAPRDHALFAMPLTYLRPERARELLRFVMQLQRGAGSASENGEGAVSYSYHGHGVADDALIHGKPSDLDLFLFMGVAEYLSATGDRTFLEEDVPFYPPSAATPFGLPGRTVLDHLRVAARHLIDTVGVGEHGLVRVGDGDWNDGIIYDRGLDGRDNTIANGESHANSAMAAAVLPAAVAVLQASDADLAAELAGRATALREVMRGEWAGRWYPRAYLRDAANAPLLLGADDSFLWLETQPWALLGDVPDATQQATLVEQIRTRLDDPSPIGALIQEPVDGREESAQVWPAITGLLTWAYSRIDPELAWRSVLRNSYVAHAEAYPGIWYGIWSGPDGTNGVRSKTPGYAWQSIATPMTDFPVMNMNPDAMGLLGVIRAAGIEPVRGGTPGLRLKPAIPGDRFVLDLPLLRLEGDPGRIGGEYRAHNDGSLMLEVVLPAGASLLAAEIAGQPLTPESRAGEPDTYLLPLTFTSGEKVSFEVSYTLP